VIDSGSVGGKEMKWSLGVPFLLRAAGGRSVDYSITTFGCTLRSCPGSGDLVEMFTRGRGPDLCQELRVQACFRRTIVSHSAGRL